MSGVVIAQILQFLSIPVLAFFYSPSEFGIFGIFTSIVALVVGIIFFRYEQVIVTAKKDTELNTILLLCSILGLIMIPLSSIIFIAVSYFFFPELFSQTMIFLFFSYITLESANKFFLHFFNRTKKYKLLSLTKVLQALFVIIISVVITKTNLKPIGLIIGFIGGSLSVFVTFLVYNLKTNALSIEKSNWSELKQVIYKYKNFPLFTMPNDFLNTFSRQIPMLILPSYFSISEVGIYTMAVRLVNAPISLFGYAYGQVFFQKLSRLFELKPNKIASFFHQNVKYLAKMSLTVVVFVWFIAPYAIQLFFNQDWISLPLVMKLLLPWSVLMFITSPLTFIVLVLNKQKKYFLYELTLAALRVLTLITSITLGLSFYLTVFNYALIGFLMNALLLKFLYHFSKRVPH